MRRVGTLALIAFVALLLQTWSASASTAPTTPTFELKWGGLSLFSGLTSVATDASGNVFFVEYGASRIHKCDRWGNEITSWSASVVCLTTDPSGNVYATDYYGNHVRKYSNSGTLLATWGSAGSGAGQFANPGGLATDRAGNVYVTDVHNNRVQKFTSSGTYVAQFVSLPTLGYPTDVEIGPEGNVVVLDFNDTVSPRIVRFAANGSLIGSWPLPTGDLTRGGIGMDRLGNVYVATSGGNKILEYTQAGTLLTQWGTTGSGDGQFSDPEDVAVDAAGNVYVAEYSNQRIQKFSGSGETPTATAASYVLKIGTFGSGAGQMNGPWGTCTDAAGNVYVSDTQNNRVQKYSSTGTFLTQWGSTGSGNGQFNLPRGIAVDGNGTVYVVDGGNNRVQKFTSAGTYVGQWGSLGSGAGQFNSPVCVAVSPSNEVYVTDYGNNRVQMFNAANAFFLQWGGAGNGDGQFNGPFGIAMDANYQVYVTDQNNARVQKFGHYGLYITQWDGSATPGGYLSNVTGIAVDGLGNVFVTDYGNGRVVDFTTHGRYQSTWGTTGAANGQMAAPIGIGVDAAGNVYVADTNNSRIQKFAMPPSIALVSDVGNDQGRQASLRFLRSSADVSGAGVTVTGYEVYRRIDPLPAPSMTASASHAGAPNELDLAGWSYVTSVPAHGETEYNAVVPTLADATTSSVEYSAFMVRAVTADPFTFYSSGNEFGYSIDNLAPPTPTPFLAARITGETHLHWGASPAADFSTFRLYRGSSAGFTPGAGNLVSTTPDTNFVDGSAAGSWYKLAAVDFNGNESPVATLGPGQTTDVEAGEHAEFALARSGRNPSTDGTLAVAFSLARAGAVRLEVVDVAGRRVAERQFPDAAAGRRVVDLGDGHRFAPGVYLVLLSQGDESRTLRVTVLR